MIPIKYKSIYGVIMRLFLTFTLLAIIEKGYCQELTFDGGIFTEKPVAKKTDKHLYSRDNISYKMNKTFIYDYYYIDQSGKKSKFLLSAGRGPENNALNLAPFDHLTDSTITNIKLSVTDSVETFWAYNADYTLTVISYSYIINNESKSDSLTRLYQKKHVTNRENTSIGVSTGVIDNSKNLWMHPPRQFSFKILQMSPFPFYVLDETVMHWSWKLDVDEPYFDSRWLNLKKAFQLQFNYQRQPDQTISTPFGLLKCRVTMATGTAPPNVTLKKTSLKSYYHPDYGFLRLEYTNINASKMVINLIKIRDSVQ